MVGLSLVAVLAIAAITASSASALPEWGKCEVKAGGSYSDANCTTKAKPKGSGGFEWIKGKNLANVKFTGESVGGGGVLTTGYVVCQGGTYQNRRVTIKKCEEGGGENFNNPELTFYVECASETNTGESSGTNLILKSLVTFKGCNLFGTAPCTSEGAAEGEVKVKPLKGKLGYIKKSTKEVGVVLEPTQKHGVFAAFSCTGGISTSVGAGNSKEGTFYQNSPGVEKNGGYDQVISPITPVNTMTSEYTQVYTVNPTTLENIPNKLEGKHISLLEDYLYQTNFPEESSKWSNAGEEITNVNTPEEEGEIKA